MKTNQKIKTYHTSYWILLQALVSIGVVGSCLVLPNYSYSEEQVSNTTQTYAKTKTPDHVSASKAASDTPVDKPGESRKHSSPTTPKPVVKESVLGESEQWQNQVEELIDQIKMGEKSSEDADAVYHELSYALRKKRQKFRQALQWARSPSDVVHEKAQPGITKQTKKTTPIEGHLQPATVKDLHATMVSLYRTRDKLLQAVTPSLREQVTGTGIAGMRKLKGEMEFMLLHLRFHAMAIPQLGPQLLYQLKVAPVPVIWHFLELLFALLLFHWWRKWAPGGLKKLRARILQIKPRSRASVRVARTIWYLEQIRRPLEWIILTSVIFDAIYVPSLAVIEHFFRIIIMWILIAWFAVVLIHAISSRGVAGLSSDRSGLRLRSLKLLATWLVLLGLGLELAETYTGQGTIYARVWLLFKILSVPVFILLLAWWRSEIFRNLANLPVIPDWVKKALLKRKGLGSYVNALSGGIYLFMLNIRRLSLRQLAKFEGGREILAGLLGREVAREDKRHKQTIVGDPISKTLREELLTSDGKILEKVSSNELKQIVERVEFGHGGIIGVVGERGLGKSLFLRRLATKFQDKAIIIQCSLQGFDHIKKEFARNFKITEDHVSPVELAELINSSDLRFIAFDDAHRLVRPKMGGQAELNRLSEFTIEVKASITWIVVMDKHAYQYVQRVRSDRAMLEGLIDLPTWTQEQISELIEYRCLQAGINPDFSQMVISHRFDEIDYVTLEERNRSGFYRILWNAAGGNPSVALRLWADALAVRADEHVVVRHLPRELATGQLEGANLSVLLLLRVIAQSEMSTIDDISESLQLPLSVVSNAVRFAMIRGWIEDIDGYYRISWRWYRAIIRILARQNLLAREFFQETH